MNLDGAREIWRATVVLPIIVREPRVLVGYGHEFTRTCVIEIDNALVGDVVDAFNSMQRAQHFPHLRLQVRIRYINMSDLMVRYREGFRHRGIQHFATILLSHSYEARIAQRTIDMDRPIDVGDAI